jgi:putative transposase
MVSPSAKRRAIKVVIETGGGTTAQACRALGLARSSYYRNSTMSQESRQLHGRIVDLSQEHPRDGYRRVTAVLRRAGQEVNAKRVQRVRRKEGLQVSRRQRKLRRLGVSTAQRQRASQTNDVWSWDFVEDQTENGTRFRVLTLIDEHTRECLAMHVDWSIRAVDVITVVEAAMARYGLPGHLRSDNGPEFIAYAIQDWLKGKNVKTIYIKPGSPWENAYIESFHDKLRDECLNREIFGSLWEARVVIEQWRLEYNTERPHSSLGYQTPVEFGGRAIGSLELRSGYALPPFQRTEQNIKPVAGLSL